MDKPTAVHETNAVMIRKVMAKLYTDDVAACVRFWVDRLHFKKTVGVPGDTGLAFAAPQQGSVELPKPRTESKAALHLAFSKRFLASRLLCPFCLTKTQTQSH